MKYLSLIIMFALAAGQVNAQNIKDNLRNERLEFVKKKLSLTPEEEKLFVPLYNSYLDEFEKARKEAKEEKDLANIDLTFMSDQECEEIINDYIQVRQNEVDILKKYTAEFKKILPVKKVAMIYKAEFEFKKVMVRKFREKRR